MPLIVIPDVIDNTEKSFGLFFAVTVHGQSSSGFMVGNRSTSLME